MKPIIMVILLILSFAFLAYSIYRLVRRVQLGKRPVGEGAGQVKPFDSVGERIKNVLVFVFGQKRLLKFYTFAGVEHFMLFWGFVIITLGTIEILIAGIFPGFKIAPGPIHEGLLLIWDILFTLVLVAICMGIINRTVINKRREVNSLDAILILGLIAGLMITALASNGALIAMGAAEPAWMPISNLVSSAFTGMSRGGMELSYEFFWWFHVLIVLGFLNYLPYSKHSHILTVLPNVFFSRLEPRGAIRPIDFENIPDDVDHFGAKTIHDFTWKDLLDAYTCTECGRCTDQCPAWHTNKVLSPREIVVKLRHYAVSEGERILAGETLSEEEMEIPNEKWVTPDELWACTTCNACVEQCPLLIDQMGKIVVMRQYLTLQGKLSGTAVKTLQKLQTQGNPWGFPSDDRAKWVANFDGLNIIGANGNGDASQYDVIYWMGCYGGYDPRGEKTAQAFVSLLQQAGVNFAILGPMETCTGDPARRLGEEALYQMLATQNIETMNELKVKKIVANCPHCFNTIKNEYSQFGGNFEVVSYIEFLQDLIKQGKLKPTKEMKEIITFHDPCYLGRYNRIFDAPRDVLSSIPGVELVEMPRCREKGFCCGAGGGKIWMEEEPPRVNWNRFEEVESLDPRPNTLALACYFCDTMFEDAAKHAGNEEIAIKDIATILKESVDEEKK
ncbi:MAG TPA: heterodisulfide reductase-related iron-sulfur binding cluster [Thermodesulfobacteriota bacterium]|nr:heterodisulfide reductase-related iron-sulfur binding cluster [Thermodesulfobacteriota bacterium]